MIRRDDNFAQRVVSGFAWDGGGRLVIQVVSWFSTIYVARILNPNDYGIVAVSGIFVGLLHIVGEFGLSQGLINKDSVTDEEEDTVFWISASIACFGLAAVWIAAPMIEQLFKMDGLAILMQVSALALPLTTLKLVPLAKALRELNYRYRALVEAGAQLIAAATVIGLATGGYGAWSLVISYIAAQVFTTLAYLPLLGRLPKFQIRLSATHEVIVFGARMMGANLLEYFVSRTDMAIIGLRLGQGVAGIYSMAFQLATLPLDKIGSIFNRVAFPALSAIKGDRRRSGNVFLELHKYLLAVGLPLIVGMGIVADEAITLLLTEKWRESIPVLQVVCIINVIRLSGMLMPYVLSGRGRADLVVKYQLLSVIVLPPAFLVGSMWGLDGILAAWVLGYIPLYLFLLRSLLIELGISTARFFHASASPVISVLIMAAAVVVTKLLFKSSSSVLILSSCTVVGAAVYLSCVYIAMGKSVLEFLKRGTAIASNGIVDGH